MYSSTNHLIRTLCIGHYKHFVQITLQIVSRLKFKKNTLTAIMYEKKKKKKKKKKKDRQYGSLLMLHVGAGAFQLPCKSTGDAS